MKKLLVLILVTMFLAAGCFSSKKENPEPELTISTEGTVKMVDGATLKINVTSTKSESIPDEELEGLKKPRRDSLLFHKAHRFCLNVQSSRT